jgi:peptidoglycan hydrolase-like protein with peptidoglycan-binding domain
MTYQLGSLGDDVALIQRSLAELGFYHGPADGLFGGG